VNVAVGLLLCSVVVLAVAPAHLGTLTRDGITPRLGIAAWVIVVASVPAVWLAAGAITIAEGCAAGVGRRGWPRVWLRYAALPRECFATPCWRCWPHSPRRP
jgi:hypothetical protein